MAEEAPSSDETIVAEAAAWIVRLTADDVRERRCAEEGFRAWKAADSRHARAAASLEALLATTRSLAARPDATPARKALERVFALRKRTRVASAAAALCLVCVLALPVWPLWNSSVLASWRADWRTVPGEWSRRQLADGSRVVLAGASAMNFHLNPHQRRLELLQGEVLVDVARDPVRPFVVSTRYGSIEALGTRFLVRSEADATVLVMIESRVRVRTGVEAESARNEAVEVQAGQRVRLTTGGVDGPVAVNAVAIGRDWEQKRLVVQDQPLAEVLKVLARQYRGWLDFNADDLTDLRVSAVLPLDDPAGALALLAVSFPQLRWHRFTPYYLRLERQS